MAYSYVFLTSARQEISEIIAHFTKETGNTKAASTWIGSFEERIDLICEHPQMYPLSYLPELAKKGYRSARVGSYVLLYTVSEDTVFVEHIFHQRRDYASLV